MGRGRGEGEVSWVGGFGEKMGRGRVTARMKNSMDLLDGSMPRNEEVVLDQEEVSSVVVLF